MAQFLCGLDLGQAADYSALVIAERCETSPAEPARVLQLTDGGARHIPAQPAGPVRYDVRHIERFTLGTPYPEIVDAVGRILGHPAMGSEVTLVVDGTGVGRAVVDLFRLAAARYAMVPAMITAGDTARNDAGWWYVPKRELVGVVQVLLQSQRVRFAQALPETALLTAELQNFQIKVTAAANETFNAREGKHDDLVLALALAVWYGERVGGIRIRWIE